MPMQELRRTVRRMLALRGVQAAALVLTVAAVLRLGGSDAGAASGPAAPASSGSSSGSPGYRGVLTFATPGNGDPFAPTTVQDYDLATGQLTVRFDGLDPARGRTGETAYIQRLAGGWAADHGVVVADARDIPGAPVFVCKDFNWTSNLACRGPKVSPNGRLVAFAATGGSGNVCRNSYGMFWAEFVIVTDRRGAEVARFEGYGFPEWLPDGRLIIMGSQCRNAGIWMTDTGLGSLRRIDRESVSIPAGAPAASPDGSRLAFVWNRQLWTMSLDGRAELTQVTRLPKSVQAAAWSPDGEALALLLFDVSMPVRSLALLRPGDQSSLVVKELPVYPYGPLSWR